MRCRAGTLVAYGVFAPHSELRAAVTPAQRGRGAVARRPADPRAPRMPRHVAMSWAWAPPREPSLVSSGEHGWFRLNVSDTPVTITLSITGFQDKLMNYGLLE